jgi:hypothetical protein
MKATYCGFYRACRVQQMIVAQRRAKGQSYIPCHADEIGCSNKKENMECICPCFLLARKPYTPITNLKAYEYSH